MKLPLEYEISLVDSLYRITEFGVKKAESEPAENGALSGARRIPSVPPKQAKQPGRCCRGEAGRQRPLQPLWRPIPARRSPAAGREAVLPLGKPVFPENQQDVEKHTDDGGPIRGDGGTAVAVEVVASRLFAGLGLQGAR